MNEYPPAIGSVYGRSFLLDSAFGFAQFGMDRWVAEWIPLDTSKTIIHVGPGEKHIHPERSVLVLDYPDWDAEKDEIPLPDDSVGGIVATHFLEHLQEPRQFLCEAARVLAPGCPLNILVPHADSLMAKQDLDHKSQYVLDTWRVLLNNPYYNKNNNAKFDFELGANFVFGVKEGNFAVVTQLIKKGTT
jgi:SAM-dependent methyltransferase